MIRRYTPEDKEQLLELLDLNTPLYFAASEKQDFILYLAEHLEDYFVVELEGKIMGCGGINYFAGQTEARLSWDIIHPEFQGKGIGKALAQYRISHIKSTTPVHILYVRTSQHVYKFYQKMGFTLEKTEQDFWAKGFDLYQMRLDIIR